MSIWVPRTNVELSLSDLVLLLWVELCSLFVVHLFLTCLYNGRRSGLWHMGMWASLVKVQALSSFARTSSYHWGLQYLQEGTSDWFVDWFRSEKSIWQKILLSTDCPRHSFKAVQKKKVSKLPGQTHLFPEYIAIPTNNKWRQS